MMSAVGRYITSEPATIHLRSATGSFVKPMAPRLPLWPHCSAYNFICLINGQNREIPPGLVDDEVPLMELTCHIRMFVFKIHHVAQINWNPSGILDLNLDSIRNPEADNEQVINAGRHLLSLLYDFGTKYLSRKKTAQRLRHCLQLNQLQENIFCALISSVVCGNRLRRSIYLALTLQHMDGKLLMVHLN